MHISSLSRCQEGIVPHSSPSYGLLPYCRFRLPPQSDNTTPLFQTSSTFVQLPRKTGRTISSHPQAFPLALSVHIQNCHKYFRENLSKVFTRTAVTIPGTFSPFGDRQGRACLPLLQQLAPACQGRFIWLTDCHILELTIQVTRLPTMHQLSQSGNNRNIYCTDFLFRTLTADSLCLNSKQL